MSVIDDGGPAFPGWSENHYTDNHPRGGMSLRDYMAIHASERDILEQAELIRARLRSESPCCVVLPDDWCATARYMHADAMLQARKKKDPS